MQNVYFAPNRSETGKTFFNLDVVGENSYQKNIREVIGYEYMVDKDDLQHTDERLIATLILEDENEYDPGNAVRIDIDNKPVGYLKRDDAKVYRQALANLNLTEAIGTCQAKASGRREAKGRQMKFGIWLAIEPERGLTIGEAPKKEKGCLSIFATITALALFVAVFIA